MKTKIESILTEYSLNKEQTLEDATQQILHLFEVSDSCSCGVKYVKTKKSDIPLKPQLHKHNVNGSFSIPKYRKTPIIIMKWNDGAKGWRAEIADNYKNYKPTKYDDINFEDLGFHFRHDIETHPNDDLVFLTRKDAVNCAKFCNEKYLDGKAKIWFIS